MKALPLWQPWASLVAIGAKRVETRHWSAPQRLVGQRIAIHATKTTSHLAIATTEPFVTHLQRAGVMGDDPRELPLGCIVATAVLESCAEMTPGRIEATRRTSPDEYEFGLFEPGRFAWAPRDVERLAVPVPFRGSQGIFDVPDELLTRHPEETHAPVQ